MKTEEDKFKHEIDIFRTEVESGIQFFYMYLAFNSVLSKNKQALKIVNRTPLFWNTNVGALQTSFFIVLGRLFDQNSNHNVDRLIGVAQKHSDIFSAEALEVRKRAGSANAGEWINDYMKDVYVPTNDDFRRLRKYVSKYRKIYENTYRDIRHKVYAHKVLSNKADVHNLFARTNIREIQKLLIFLNRVHEALWQLFHNGRKPTLRAMKYSVSSIMKNVLAPEWQSRQIQELVVHETQKFFDILLSIPNKREQEKDRTLYRLKEQ
ncbi:MAG: hypothetical protein Q8P28_02170 [Deltaproteobacteria bacterium]|nr:hypothetical protein [Deltaproteobacteria bacterium]